MTIFDQHAAVDFDDLSYAHQVKNTLILEDEQITWGMKIDPDVLGQLQI